MLDDHDINIPSVVFVKLDSSWLVKVDFVFNCCSPPSRAR